MRSATRDLTPRSHHSTPAARRSITWSAVSIVWAGAIAVALLFAGMKVAVLVALVPAGALLALAVLPHALHRRALGLILTWAGLLAPFIIVEARNVDSVQASLLTPLNIFQGLAPMGFFVLARLVCRKRVLPLRSSEIALVGFAAVCMLSMLWSVDPLATALRAAQLLVVYLLLVLLVRQLGSASAVVRHVVGATYVAIAAALVGAVVDPAYALAPTSTYDFTRNTYVSTAARLQAVLPYIHPDLLGLVAVVALLSLVCGIGPRWSRSRSMQVLILGSSSVVLVLTQTRSALVLFLIGLLVLAALDARSRSRILVLALIALVIVLLVPALQSTIAEHLRRGQDAQSFGTLTGRTTTWHDALVEWAKRPATGYGYYAGHRFSGFSASRDLSNLDNMYVETLVDVGLVGLGALLLFVFAGLRRVVHSARCRARSFSLAVISALLVGAAVNPSLQTPGVALIIAGLLLVAPWEPAARRNTRRRNSSAIEPTNSLVGASGAR
jgi:O-antigen ligase